MSLIAVDPAHAGDYPPSIQAILKRKAPAAALLRQTITAIDAETGAAEITYEVHDDLLNRFGALHGGMTAAMLDDALSIAAGLSLQWGEISPTLSLTVNYLAIAKPGKLHASARVVRRGRSVMFLEAQLRREGGEMVATATAAASIIQNKKD